MFIPLDQTPSIEDQINAMRNGGTVPRLPDQPLPREELQQTATRASRNRENLNRSDTLSDMGAATGVTNVLQSPATQDTRRTSNLTQNRPHQASRRVAQHSAGNRQTGRQSRAGEEEPEDAQKLVEARSLGQAIQNYLGQLRDNLQGLMTCQEEVLTRRYEVLEKENAEVCMVEGALALNRNQRVLGNHLLGLSEEHRAALQRSQELLQKIIRNRTRDQVVQGYSNKGLENTGRGPEERTQRQARTREDLRDRRRVQHSAESEPLEREHTAAVNTGWNPWGEDEPDRRTGNRNWRERAGAREPERERRFEMSVPQPRSDFAERAWEPRGVETGEEPADHVGHRGRNPQRNRGYRPPGFDLPRGGQQYGRARSSPPPGAGNYEPYSRFFGQAHPARAPPPGRGFWGDDGEVGAGLPEQDLFGEQAPADFYRSLPEGWREPPRGHGALSFGHLSSLQRSGYMPTFNGKVENYHGFKMHFLVAVHRLPLPVLAKHMALRGVLEKIPELETFVGTVEPGLEGYAAMIWELEDRYGGRERLLHRHASNIKFLPTVSEDNLQTLEKFLSSVHAYHTALNNDQEIGSYHHFNELYYKLEHALRIKYRTYCRTLRVSSAEESSAFTLVDWLKNVIMLPLRLDPRESYET